MKLNLLGTGGVTPIPKPCCNCELCNEAREKGIIDYQTGPSMFVYDDNILFDTPEEIRLQLNREKIEKVENIILTHWHPDHTQGIRIVEQINFNHIKGEAEPYPINLFIAKKQLEQFKKFGCGNMLSYYESRGVIKIIYLEHKQTIKFKNVMITPYYISKTEGYYFLIEDNKNAKKVIYAPCEYHELNVYSELNNIDMLIAHCLYFENKEIGSGVDYSDTEDSFEKMLKDSNKMGAKKIAITHIEEAFQLNIEQLNNAVRKYYRNYNVEFAKDGRIFEL